MRRHLTLLILFTAVGVIAGLRCGSDKSSNPDVPTYGIIPDSLALEVSSSQQFEAVFEGETPELVWSVGGIVGGSPGVGVITQDGLYVAPAGLPQGAVVTVSAAVVENPTQVMTAKVLLDKDSQTPYVSITPSDTVVAVADSVEFLSDVFGCSTGDVVWTIVLGTGPSSDIGSIGADGIYVAPATAEANITLIVMAESQSCLDKTGLAAITVKPPATFFVELEDFADSSGVGIDRSVSCGGGLGVTGLNTPDEWISIPMEVAVGGRYTGYIRYAAGDRDTLEVTVAAEGCGDGGSSPAVTFMIDQGSGVGG
jgi:hypothetical protein